MKQISLMKLVLLNFKGIREFVLEVNGKSVKVYGDNAVGKTTIFDAFTWVLFDKDSQNKQDFGIKTLDAEGKELHRLSHEVEAILLVDGKRKSLRKVLNEKWVKKRGLAREEFSGHTTEYFIDGVPVKLKEYKEQVESIMSEDLFKLLTNPSYFNEQLHWESRRKVLLQVCGDVIDEEVIKSEKSLAPLMKILNERSIEQHRKVIDGKCSEISKELDQIPVRIDEATRSMPDTSGLNENELGESINALQEQITSKEAEAFRLRSGGEIAVKQNRIREIEGELLQIKNDVQAGTLEKVAAKRQELSNLNGQLTKLNQQISDAKRAVARNEQLASDELAEADRLRHQWHKVNDEVLEYRHDDNCPTCGQTLPEENIEAARTKALSDFNYSKAERLEKISAKGRAAKEEATRLSQDSKAKQQKIAELEQLLEEKSNEIQKAESELEASQASIIDVEMDPNYITKQMEISVIQEDIEQIRKSVQEAAAKVAGEIQSLKAQKEALEQDKAKFSLAQTVSQRIEQLKTEEKELVTKYEELQHELYLTEEFIRAKVSLLETKINSKFQHARFKLFEQQINGGLKERCDTLYRGVPYGSGLNNAARINVGLDIINTLSEHYGITAPIFVDNAEAVTKMIEISTQVISLIVSEKDKQLRVVVPVNIKEAV
ncbi:AAA family ATPase [Brevibacillus porteri]|uniref:Nuclease SbcCD subunit C n=1 Tax=Brevibacillus porteri TaxID=2126350 RepID=A0ABX5FRQ0_9BACL|nr:AAA family ATPase [Brevibacillus porteri]MED1800651.1 AAA family ATPase [Brevibacillus porteri]MED2134721.1 AAA family ATPase [Brevibacillus porteri]MED2745622.1 AAA family ATPase [Brevibacillus porteri]MED2814740.1 AAA family ATPase [Brevibacillus porteri]MED2898063.1 AAA family ATPase [Brevibacillus porteri]